MQSYRSKGLSSSHLCLFSVIRDPDLLLSRSWCRPLRRRTIWCDTWHVPYQPRVPAGDARGGPGQDGRCTERGAIQEARLIGQIA